MTLLRTRLHTATATVPCTGETHTINFNYSTGEVTYPHEEELDEVVAALGGSPHVCKVVLNAYHAALDVVDSYLGAKDPQGFKYIRPVGWSNNATCPSCVSRGGHDFIHLLTPEHQAHTLGCETELVKKFIQWVFRNKAPESAAQSSRIRELTRALQDNRILPEEENTLRHVRYLHRQNITPGFVAIAMKLVSTPTIHRISDLRKGITIQWGQQLIREIDPTRLAYAHRNNINLHTSLIAARNIAPEKVAAYLNRGITSHYHTYVHHNAPIDAILEVYRRSNGQKTLAEFLKTGYAIPQAIQLVKEHYPNN